MVERRDRRDREVINGKTLTTANDGAFPAQFSHTVPTLCKTREGPVAP